MKVRTALVGVLFAAVIGYAQAPASKEPEKAKPAAPPQSKPAAPASGAMVFIDPVTHEIRQPDESEIGAMAATAAAAAKGKAAVTPAEPVFIKGPNGAVGMKAGAESLSYMVATKLPDGSIVMECVTGDKAAEAKAAPAEAKQAPQR